MKIIVNPQAGHGRSQQNLLRLKSILRARRINVEVLETCYPGHAVELAREITEQGEQKVVVMGGDGTISEVVNGVVGSPVTLGIIPVGTGNDLARSLALPINRIEAAVDVILSGQARAIDLGEGAGRYFVSLLGVGFPAIVAEEANRMKQLRGPVAFFISVYKALYRMQALPMEVHLDDEVLRLLSTSVLIQNTPYTGGGLLMAPQAKMDDGFLHVVVVDNIGKLDLMVNFPRIYRGKHVRHRKFSIYRAKSVRVVSEHNLQGTFDGEVESGRMFEARVVEKAIRVLVPERLK